MKATVAFLLGYLASFFSSSHAASFTDLAPFDTNHVLAVDLKISDAHWNELRYQHREGEFFPEEGKPAPADPYSWFPAEATIDGRAVGPVELRKKGYIGSNDVRRPALKLRLATPPGKKSDNEDKASGASLELTFNNNRQDPALIRQYLAYEVFRRAGVPAPRCSFVNLKVNGRDLGIYTCVQPINAAFLKEHFGRSDGDLYEGGRSDFRSNWVQNFGLKNNRKGNDRADLERAANAVESSKDSILPILNAHFDAEEFFRFWAIESLINQTDGYAANMNNFYLYQNPSTGKFVFIPWGADSCFYAGRPINSVRGDPKSVIGTGILANRLYNSEDGAAKYRATLRSIMDHAWNEAALVREVARLEALLSPVVGPGSAEFKGYIEEVRRFIKARRAEISPELNGPVPALKSRPLELAKRRNVGRFSGKFSTTLPNNAVRQPANSVELSGKLWDQQITFRDISLQAQVPQGANADSDERIMIFLSGSTQANGKQYAIYFQVDPESYAPGTPIPIDHTHVIGWFSTPERMIGMIRGSLLLTKAGTTPGSEIAGEFTAEVFSKLPKQ